ncbi:MAG: 2-oxoacid:acceptor oxidoreductase subunit alpha [Planctomycetes bacterium]|nr:2-oxoacid:acceptor oxidoreductase subunit alpha [Planctomycetota bacterium]
MPVDTMPTPAAAKAPSSGKPVINDFSIQVATANGSGSQSSNNVLLRSILQMGIPVSGKNLFPSNIQGLPTWFTIRVSKDGYIARRKVSEIFVAMNEETIDSDITDLTPGNVLIWNSDLRRTVKRDDLIEYPVPFNKLSWEACPDPKLRKLVTNMVYVGVVVHLLGIEIAECETALKKQFKSKQKAIDLNLNAIKFGVDWAQKNLVKKDPYRVERMNKTAGQILIEGNTAAAIGALMGGVTVCTWYPITPSSSLVESLIDLCRKYRKDPVTGKTTVAIVQAEDELASIGMVLGAGWAGARSMTATAGPGISLMSEFVGLAYFADVPGVIFDVQRVGPSTGLPTRTSQGDILKAATLSHGDTKHPMLIPASVQEAYQFAQDAFDLAEQVQSVVFVMLDLDLGMNFWMSDPFPYPTKPLNRGKVLTKDDLDRLGKFERYRDVDGDGIPYRTLPGNPHPLAPYFTRGSGHNEKAQYTERPSDYRNLMNRLAKKFETMRDMVPAPVIEADPKAEIGIIAYGTSHWATVEARDQLRAQGVPTAYLRLRGYPFNSQVAEFIDKHPRLYLVEQNRDGQMQSLLSLDMPQYATKFRPIRHYTGNTLDAAFIVENLRAQEKGGHLGETQWFGPRGH